MGITSQFDNVEDNSDDKPSITSKIWNGAKNFIYNHSDNISGLAGKATRFVANQYGLGGAVDSLYDGIAKVADKMQDGKLKSGILSFTGHKNDLQSKEPGTGVKASKPAVDLNKESQNTPIVGSNKASMPTPNDIIDKSSQSTPNGVSTKVSNSTTIPNDIIDKASQNTGGGISAKVSNSIPTTGTQKIVDSKDNNDNLKQLQKLVAYNKNYVNDQKLHPATQIIYVDKKHDNKHDKKPAKKSDKKSDKKHRAKNKKFN